MQRLARFSFVFFCVAMALSLAMPAPARAEVDAASTTYIKVLGRQNALGHRIARAMCFAHIGVDRDANLQRILESGDEMDRVLTGLLEGDAELGIPQITDDDTVTRIKTLMMVWKGFRKKTIAFAEGEELTAKQLNKLAFKSDTLDKFWDAIMSEIQLDITVAAGPEDLAFAQRLSAEVNQARLLQRAGKSACLIKSAGTELKTEKHIAALNGALQEFHQNAFGLAFGAPSQNMIPPPNDAAQTNAFEVWQNWMSAEASFSALQSDANNSDALFELSSTIEFLHVLLEESLNG